MSEPENFLTRWSRRKRAAAEPAAELPAQDARVEEKKDPASEQASLAPAPGATKTPAFDLSSLPPIESIVAGTDIRPFLAPGVPAEITRAALRRAWTADPSIRDFVGLSENAWDFTKQGVPGFGPLLPIDDVKKLVAQIFNENEGEEREPSKTDSAVLAATDAKSVDENGSRDLVPEQGEQPPLRSSATNQRLTTEHLEENGATQNSKTPNDDTQVTPKHGHGGALPR
jgi:hypothetical protein